MCSASASTTAPDYAVSAPAVVLAAAAARTKRIRLTSAVTVLSSDDPVRVFQDFATLDLLSGGRAEIMAGRGSFIESFPLFGYDLDDYDELFAEKLELLLKLRDDERVTWRGSIARRSTDLGVYPRPLQEPLPVWIAVGGTPQSVVRAATLGLPMALAIIGGAPERFAPLVDLYREAAQRAGTTRDAAGQHQLARLRRARPREQAADEFFPPYADSDDPDRPRARLAADDAAAVRGATLTARRAARGQPAGSDRQDPVRARAVRAPALPGADQRRHDAARQGMQSIELLGTKVAPVVRRETAGTTTVTPPPGRPRADSSLVGAGHDPPPAVGSAGARHRAPRPMLRSWTRAV